jgi:sugar lactone lactonase YvrE
VERWQAELVLDARANLGEGPLWDARSGELLWVDIMVGIVHRFDLASGVDRAFDVGQPVGAVVPRASGGYAFALRDGFAVGDAGGVTVVAPIETDRLDVRMNDGACDSRGRFWAGTMQLENERGAGALFRLDATGAAETMLTGVTVSNGIAWSPDDATMYYVDTTTRGIDSFDFDVDTGTIAGRRRLATIEKSAGHPDGLIVDAEGCLWVALWEGWAVRRYAPDGTLLGIVEIPAARVTKPAFGGDALDELYVTTASPDERDDAQPHAGGIFRARPGVRGLAPHAYTG